MDNKNKNNFKNIKQIILDGDSEQQEKDKKRPEDLLIKYIKEINDFKTRVEKKYRDNGIKDISFSMESSYTWLGEGLDIESNHGDKMSIFEEREPVIEYNEIDVNNPKQEIEIEIYQTETLYEKFGGKIYKDNDGYYLRSYHKEENLIFNSIEELLDFYCKRDEIYQKFDSYGSFDDSERFFEFKVL